MKLTDEEREAVVQFRIEIISQQEGVLFQDLFELRQDGDYSDWIILVEEDVIPLIEPVKRFIDKIERLVSPH